MKRDGTPHARMKAVNTVQRALATILRELGGVIRTVDRNTVQALRDDIVAADRVFVAGAGRSLLLLKGFAKRLSHAGIDVHVIGETTTPPVKSGHLLVVASCSGNTVTPLAVARSARAMGTRIWGITAAAGSPMARQCHRVLILPAPGYRSSGAPILSRQPMNNLFDQVLHVVLDTLSWAVQESLGVGPDWLRERHANIE